jgi:anti-sigma regulatory factor (Ser/Thr protein kinase)
MSGGTLNRTWTTPGNSFRHEALLYDGSEELLGTAERFVRDGRAADERILVVLSGSKLESLRRALGAVADTVQFADMDEVGCNPARIIPLWRRFVDSVEPGRPVRGIGEPVNERRIGAQLAECQVHEELLNVAFEGGSPFWLLCPYDTSSLGSPVVDQARHSHPYLTGHVSETSLSDSYRGVDGLSLLHRDDLRPVPDHAFRLTVTAESVGMARTELGLRAIALGLGSARTDDLASAAHELIANSVFHGGGRGDISLWLEDGSVICEVKDRGVFDNPMAGRIRPSSHGSGGRGLWIANQLCDLVQIRSLPDASVVRLHMAVDRQRSGVR